MFSSNVSFISACGIACMLFGALAVFNLVASFEIKCSMFYRAFCILPAAFSTLSGSLMAQAAISEFKGYTENIYLHFVLNHRGLFEAPLIVTAAADLVMINLLFRKRRMEIGPDSIKELFDELPDGIAFSDGYGISVLSNKRINELKKIFYGKDPTDNNEAWERIFKKDVASGMEILNLSSDATVSLPDNTVLSMRKRELPTDRKITEYTAVDITEEYALYKEVGQNNIILSGINERLREFNKNVVQYAREKENLETKIRLHDNLGRILLETRTYLEQTEEERDRVELIRRWRLNIRMLSEKKAVGNLTDEYDALTEAASQLMVKIDITGEIADDPGLRGITFQILRECMNNIVHHADGHLMSVIIDKDPDMYHIKVTNDGKRPEGEVVFGGGLSNLKRSIELLGGNMKVTSFPAYIFEAFIPV